MNNPTTPLRESGGFNIEDFQKNRGWFLILGILLLIVGFPERTLLEI